ncbi:hypothetical protein [Pseudaestuariivita rosea]|uniref:hypothetical protein n=1 Tax=Pseudaestuariivita rosea TaxID=2763263 RepID=UPI001ABBC5EC|nr:hypothetical protein [Pseudaestuariivita rosea]
MKKGYVSGTLACALLIMHCALSGLLFFYFDEAFQEEVAIAEISLPITMAYAVTVSNWIVANQGRVDVINEVGFVYVFAVVLLFIVYCAALALGPYRYITGAENWDWQRLNTYFAIVDGAVGTLLLLFCNDLFSKP